MDERRRKIFSEEDMMDKMNSERILEKKKFKDLQVDFDFLSKKPKI